MRGNKSFADDLIVGQGAVSSRVALLLRSAEAKPSLPRFVEYDVLSTRSRNATRAPPSGGQTTAPNTRRAKRRRRAPRPAGGGPAFGLCAWRRLVMGPSAPPWPRPLPGAIFEILAPPHLGGNGGSNHGRGSRSWCRVTPPLLVGTLAWVLRGQPRLKVAVAGVQVGPCWQRLGRWVRATG